MIAIALLENADVLIKTITVAFSVWTAKVALLSAPKHKTRHFRKEQQIGIKLCRKQSLKFMQLAEKYYLFSLCIKNVHDFLDQHTKLPVQLIIVLHVFIFILFSIIRKEMFP